MHILDIVFFAIFAIVIGYKLYNTLGKFNDKGNIRNDKNHSNTVANNDNIVDLSAGDFKDITDKKQQNKSNANLDTQFDKQEDDLVKKLDSELRTQLLEFKKTKSSFHLFQFLQGAEKAFEMIINAYIKGDSKILENLLEPNLLNNFLEKIHSFLEKKHKLHQEIVSVDNLALDKIELNTDNNKVDLLVKIQSKQFIYVLDSENNVIQGSKTNIKEVTDIWTFSQKISESTNIWKLAKCT